MPPYDKCLHYLVGQLAGLAWLLLFRNVPGMIMFVGVIAIGKEIYDSMHPDKHTSDVWDAIATILGCIPLAVIYFLGR